jgi:hypothetical protein
MINTRDGATYIAAKVWGVFTHYDLGGDHPLVGRSVPNFEFEDGATIADQMRDGLAILLDFDANPALASLAGEYGDRVKYLAGPAKDQLRLSCLLIRPDGIVAWAFDGKADEQAIRQAAGGCGTFVL